MVSTFDFFEEFKNSDKCEMLKALDVFPQICKETIDSTEKINLEEFAGKEYKDVTVIGVGGSAIGGQLLGDWLKDDVEIPFTVSRGYTLPKFVDEESLVFVVSYSGNTEETLCAFFEAEKRGCNIFSVTSDGELKDLTSEKGFILIPLVEGFQPRAALPNQFFSIATILKGLGLIGSLWGEVEELHRVLSLQKKELSSETPTDSNPAKRLALDVKGTIPFIYGSPLLKGVCYRLSTQLNENSKTPSGYGFFPEAFHNAIMFREGEKNVRDKISIVLVRDPLDSEAVKRRIDGFERLMEGCVGRTVSIDAKGRGKLSRIMSALYTGDYFSTYLGLLYGLDPSSTESIKMLKKWS